MAETAAASKISTSLFVFWVDFFFFSFFKLVCLHDKNVIHTSKRNRAIEQCVLPIKPVRTRISCAQSLRGYEILQRIWITDQMFFFLKVREMQILLKRYLKLYSWEYGTDLPLKNWFDVRWFKSGKQMPDLKLECAGLKTGMYVFSYAAAHFKT